MMLLMIYVFDQKRINSNRQQYKITYTQEVIKSMYVHIFSKESRKKNTYSKNMFIQ